MTADSGFAPDAVEDVNDANLLLRWKEITYALVDRGHAAVLVHLLTLRTGCTNLTKSPALGSTYPPNSAFPHVVADGTGGDSPSDDIPGDTASPLCQDESDTDDIHNIYDDFCNVPHDLVNDAKDLSMYLYPKSLAASEGERYLIANDKAESGLDHAPDHLDNDTGQSLGTSRSLAFPSASGQDHQLDALPDLGLSQDITLGSEKVIGIDDLKVKATSSIPEPPPKRRKRSAKTGTLRLSDKRDLIASQIPIVADLLVNRETMSNFLRNRHSICENFKPFTISLSEICSNSLERSVITAFETVRELLSGNQVCRLVSRFASIQLSSLIDAYKAVAAAGRTQSNSSRRRGCGDATVAIELYLEAKRKISGEISERGRILGYCRTGRRWKALAGRAPILVFMFPNIAETIVYVFSHFLCLSLTGLTGRIIR